MRNFYASEFPLAVPGLFGERFWGNGSLPCEKTANRFRLTPLIPKATSQSNCHTETHARLSSNCSVSSFSTKDCNKKPDPFPIVTPNNSAQTSDGEKLI
ncbi:hypothetical protein CEXT_440951 [Caerostris extrusa]|uniref:Uncharacterized protein n=1 Tax=Caerostris extrusa TaxID=172846 RepID=A0AAV4Y3W6_CAEEX|nr:hypothetical protein CEXT_440951 [Caerostris extrusa]